MFYRLLYLILASVCFLILISAHATIAQPVQPAEPDQPPLFLADSLTDTEIQLGIDALIEYLYSIQNDTGHWEKQYPGTEHSHFNAHLSGQTTLATWALISAGQKYQEPRLQHAIQFLARQKADYTYVRALRAHIWAALPKRFYKSLQKDSAWLLNAYGFNAGSWGYTSIPMESGYDNSLTQYGVLGLWEAAKRDLDIPNTLWKSVEQHYLKTQLADGGWNYRPQWSKARGSMTAAGLTCLFITQDYLHAKDYETPGQPLSKQQISIQAGLDWLDENFTSALHPGAPGENNEYYYYYYLYGVQRVGLASGYKRFGTHDWFREGAAEILNRLCIPQYNNDGQLIQLIVKPKFKSTGTAEVPVVQAAFALMFLSHGRVPVVMSKLQTNTTAWNNRPRDIANLTRYISDAVEQRRAWQILNINDDVDEYLESPLIYFATHQPIDWVHKYNEQLSNQPDNSIHDNTAKPIQPDQPNQPTTFERINQYINRGGLLLVCSDTKNPNVAESVKELATTMYPQYTYRQLPDDHWVYLLSNPISKKPILYGISNGVRELIIFAPNPAVSLALQTNDLNKNADIFTTLSNIYYYASERGITRARLEPKQTLFHPDASTETNQANPDITIILGQYEGNWNPEPKSPDIMQQHLLQNRKLKSNIVPTQLSKLSTVVPHDKDSNALLWVRGTDDIQFTEDELEQLKQYIQNGGYVLFENAGGIGSFGKDAEYNIRTLYNKTRFKRQGTHPVITGENLPNGTDCSRVAYRLFSLEQHGSREVRPRLRGMNPNLGLGVQIFVSRDDLSHAILNQPCYGISGYRTDDAINLLSNIIEYVASQN